MSGQNIDNWLLYNVVLEVVKVFAKMHLSQELSKALVVVMYDHQGTCLSHSQVLRLAFSCLHH